MPSEKDKLSDGTRRSGTRRNIGRGACRPVLSLINKPIRKYDETHTPPDCRIRTLHFNRFGTSCRRTANPKRNRYDHAYPHLKIQL